MRPQVIIITHTDWSEDNPNGPMLPFRTDSRESWDRVMEDLGTRARVDAIAIGCRGTFDPKAVAALPIARAAYDALQHQPSMTFWVDTIGWPDIAHNLDNPQGLEHRPFDFANPHHRALTIPHYLDHFLINFGTANLTRIDGEIVIPMWGISTNDGHGFVNQHDAQLLLDDWQRHFRQRGLGGVRFIVAKNWIDYAPNLRVWGVHNWFSGHNNPTSYTVHPHEGTHGRIVTGVVVPGFTDPNTGVTTIPHGGETARVGLQACVDGGCHFVICEGATDFQENAYWIRNAAGDDSKLRAIRELTTGDTDMSAVGSQPLFTLDHRAVIHNSDGTKSLRWNKEKQQTDHTSDRVFSLQDDGSYDDRPIEKPHPDFTGPWGIGPWEKGKPEGNTLVFRANDARAVFPWQN